MGTERTQPLSLTVAAAPQGALGQPGDNLFVEVEVGEGNRALSEGVMVQQQVPLTVRLFSARPLVGGDLSEPRVADAVISKLGEDRQYRTQRDGRDYAVVERRYSLSPEKSGDLQIPPIVFKGSVRSAQGQNQRRGIPGGVFDDPGLDRFFQAPALERFFGGSDPFAAFDRGEPVRAQSKALDLRVQARPDGVAGSNWLPAQGLEIADSWTQNPPQLRVGEPVSRTLTLTAKGLAGAQIPAVDLPAVDGLRVYPEQTQHETRTDGETIYGVSHQGLTLIPSQAGALAIPEVRVTWWDTTAQREQVATLPAWNLEVEAAAGQAAAQPLATAPGPRQTAATQPAPAVPPPDQAPGNAQAGQTPSQGADQTAAPGPARIPFYQRPNVYVGLALVIAGMVGLIVLRRRRAEAGPSAALRPARKGLPPPSRNRRPRGSVRERHQPSSGPCGRPVMPMTPRPRPRPCCAGPRPSGPRPRRAASAPWPSGSPRRRWSPSRRWRNASMPAATSPGTGLPWPQPWPTDWPRSTGITGPRRTPCRPCIPRGAEPQGHTNPVGRTSVRRGPNIRAPVRLSPNPPRRWGPTCA